MNNTNTKAEEKTGYEKARAVNEKLKAERKAAEETKQQKAVSVLSEAAPVKDVVIAERSEPILPAEIRDGQLILTEKHLQLIKSQIAPTATKEEFELFIMMARRTRLDPLLKQLHFIKYGDKVSYVTSIDGYRIIAHRTGEFDGIDEPEYKYVEKPVYKAVERTLHSCTIRVYRKGSSHAFAATVKFAEYTTGRNNWSKMPETMIAKVAEAHALRKAFPQDLSGIYTTDEMEQAKQQEAAPAKRIDPWTADQMAEIEDLLAKKGKTIDDLKKVCKAAYALNDYMKLNTQQAETIIARLKKLPDYIAPKLTTAPAEEENLSEGLDPDEVEAGIEAMRKEQEEKAIAEAMETEANSE